MALWINDGLHEAAQDIRSFLLVGQSNMAGRGDLTPESAITAPDCFMLRMGRCGIPVASGYHIFARRACTNPAFFLNQSDILQTNLANYNKVYYFIGRRNGEGEDRLVYAFDRGR